MATVNLVVLYLDVINKKLVGVNGSPTTVPLMYYGDKPLFLICPVVPNVTSNSQTYNPNNGYIASNLAGYTMNLTMAGPAPNAQSPPTPFASLDGMTWNAGLSGFTGILDLTQTAVATYLATAAQAPAIFNLDVFDASLNRTTLIQTSFTVVPSIDTPAAGPAGPAVQYLTLVQALNQFSLIAGAPGNFQTFISPDGNKTRVLSCGNDGSMLWT